MRLKDFFNWR